MKKIITLSAFLVAIVALGLVTEKITFARLTVDASSRDAWCVGIAGAEVCVDSSGNFIPTTTNVSSLGTSSLKFKNIYSAGQIGLQSVSSTTLASITPIAIGAMIYNSSYKSVCVSTSTSIGSFVFISSQAISGSPVECDI